MVMQIVITYWEPGHAMYDNPDNLPSLMAWQEFEIMFSNEGTFMKL